MIDIKVKDNGNTLSITSVEYPEHKIGEIKGDKGVYFVYLKVFEMFPRRVVFQMTIPSLKLGIQHTEYDVDILNPYNPIVTTHLLAELEAQVRLLPYA